MPTRFFIIAILLLGLTQGASASILHVSADGSGPYETISDALAAAAAGDSIVLAEGVYTGPGNRDLDLLGLAVTITSASGDPTTTVLDCQGSPGASRRAFRFHSGESSATVVAGLTVRGGYAAPNGGAVSCTGGSSPTFVRCVFLQNIASQNGGALYCTSGAAPSFTDCDFIGNVSFNYGGALRCYQASPTFTRCLIQECSSTSGGGLSFYRDCTAVIIDCLFKLNEGVSGGAIFAYDSICEITACVFTDNLALAEGGGIHGPESEMAVTDCVFTGNSGNEQGGAVSFGGVGSKVLNGCTFWANSSPRGGALRSQFTTCEVTDCSFAANEGTLQGSGVDLYYSPSIFTRVIIAFGTSTAAVNCEDAETLPVFSCSDIFGNAGGDWTGCIADQAGSSGNISADPLFCDLEEGDLTLQADSPCADGGTPGCGSMGNQPVGCGGVTAVIDPTVATTVQLAIGPNPVSPSTALTLSLDAPTQVHLAIHDARGRLVSVLHDGRLHAGQWRFAWAGRRAAAGVYFARLDAGGTVVRRKLIVVH